jgi:membrane-associated phospholipid phosphatase
MTIIHANREHFWHLLTRLGELQILLPVALIACLVLWRQSAARPLAFWWLTYLGLATLATTASKIAFIGWGIGIAELNFTGVSGHAMLAAAIYPLLLGIAASQAPPGGQKIAIAAGFMLALLVGISRLVVGAHSVSEVLAGLLLGGAVSTLTILHTRLPRDLIAGPVIPIIACAWLIIMPVQGPPTQTHSMVTRLSLSLAGTTVAHTRNELLSKARRH